MGRTPRTLLILAASLLLATTARSAIGLKIYVDALDAAVEERVTYGYDRDAVCTRGLCDDATTSCLSNSNCTGIGSGSCNYTTCAGDFNLCEDDTTICANNGDCTGIGGGTCVANPCAPPNEICGVKVESLTSGAPVEQTIWQLVCDPMTLPDGTDCQVGSVLPPGTVSWDFSGVNTVNFSDLIESSTTTVEIDSAEFDLTGGQNDDNSGDCGFDPGGAFPLRTLGREDKNHLDMANVVPTLNTLERENDVRVCDDGSICVSSSPDCDGIGSGNCTSTATIWLRAASRFEGIDGANLGEGESRICHVDDPTDSEPRTEVPLWRFPNQDAAGYYMEFGDPRWQHTAFSCENTILAPAAVRTRAATGFEGKQTGEVVNEGVVKLPSGHQFESLVVRTVTEYQVRINFLGTCNIGVDEVRTVIYLWEVPHLGTVVRLQSDKTAADSPPTPAEFIFTHLSEIDVKFGLFPPLTLNAGPVTNSTIDVSWNPGDVTSHINGYRVYWSEESGGSCSIGGEDCTADHPGAGNCSAGETCCSQVGAVCNSYDFDSVNDPGMVAFNSGCSLAAGDTQCATISMLDPGTTYYITVTAMSDFTNPESGAMTTYESTLYPTQIPAQPVDLPIEVSAATTGGSGSGAVPSGTSARPGTPLTLVKGPGSMITLNWGASCQASDTDYNVYEGVLGGSPMPVTCGTAGATSWPLTPGGGNRFYIVVPTNTSVEGSYGLQKPVLERPVSPSACQAQSLSIPVCP